MKDRLMVARDDGGRVFIGLAGVMLAGFVEEVGRDVVTIGLSEPDGMGGYTGEGRRVSVGVAHIMTVERESR